EKRSVAVQKSEIVGLIPQRALVGAAGTALRLSNAASHVLETKIRAAAPLADHAPAPPPSAGPGLDAWIDELASGSPTPGGGSAAALAGTLAAALVAMVARLTVGRKAYAGVQQRVAELLAEAGALRAQLRRLVADDAAASAKVSAAYRLPKAAPTRTRDRDA